eukprot:TRINITY_DN904_c0_g2_i1.p1 TRINITY_DN904_c0_g2~~TRINITY_DN904_c0_g2_i1.p1  ORF type:complete len:207 (-),score=20.60 TRINITY_DN904_c0_g2_i1:117-737(-)
MLQAQTAKCVVVGDGAVGKTCLLSTYAKDEFPSEYVPTVFDNYETAVMMDTVCYNLNLWDTAGQEEYDKLRHLSYPETDVFVVCFSVVDPDSLLNVSSRWVKELREHCTDPPMLLVGTKLDLRDQPSVIEELRSQGKRVVTYSEAQSVCGQIRAEKYVECSALTQQGVKTVFDEALKVVIGRRGGNKGQNGGATDKNTDRACCTLC